MHCVFVRKKVAFTDDQSALRPSASALGKLAEVEPSTFQTAMAHLFRRVGEVWLIEW